MAIIVVGKEVYFQKIIIVEVEKKKKIRTKVANGQKYFKRRKTLAISDGGSGGDKSSGNDDIGVNGIVSGGEHVQVASNNWSEQEKRGW